MICNVSSGTLNPTIPYRSTVVYIRYVKSSWITSCGSQNVDDVWCDVQIRKAQERTEKCKKETEAARQRYTRALLDLDASNGKYMEDMVEVFDRTQAFERQRLDFVKLILLELHNSLDYSQNHTLVVTHKCFVNSKAETIRNRNTLEKLLNPRGSKMMPLPGLWIYLRPRVTRVSGLGTLWKFLGISCN